MSARELGQLAAIALEVARRGSLHALSGYRKPKTIEHKGAVDLVTNFDTATEHAIREELVRATPDIPVVAEEEGGAESGDRIWFVDPIDGTTNYAHGHPFWSVSVGLVERGVPVVGAVVAPALHVEWQAWAGGPALRNGVECRVSQEQDLGESLLATGFPYDRRTSADNNFAPFFALKLIVQGIRRCGSAAIDLCSVADGTYDGYWERRLKPWDLAAGSCIATAAGGTVTTFEGSPIDLRAGNVVGSNGRIHELLLSELAKARAAG
ncbi:MAG: inositol monophosphatase [Deltaproteobacteria bacterium]|nr:inositol monophosphatase [Deltaproteobacteria bacterium]